jgi:peroxiredoxin
MSAATATAPIELVQPSLDQKKADVVASMPKEVLDVLMAATGDVIKSQIAEKSLPVGAKLPSFELPDATGAIVSSAKLLAEGPLVVVFYRGGWCPYCNIHLRALAKATPAFKAAGAANIVAIAPETPDKVATSAEAAGLAFPALSDVGQKFARSLGIVFELTAEVKAIYTQFGFSVGEINGSGDVWELPLAAAYIVAADGTVVSQFANADYTQRVEPSAILEALAALKKQ